MTKGVTTVGFISFQLKLFALQAFDAFIDYCDKNAEHNEAMQLGSCQVQAIVNDKFLDHKQRKLTMEVIYDMVDLSVPGGKGAAPTRR